MTSDPSPQAHDLSEPVPAPPAAFDDEVPWYRRAFQEDYLDLYMHRDLAEAVRAVGFLEKALRLNKSQRLLDLCCGPGRHLVFLRRWVGQAVGLDLSRALLARAREHWRAAREADSGSLEAAGVNSPQLIQATMARLPLADASFDRVVNLFTSFGYFEDEAENLAVLREVARVLKPASGGEDADPKTAQFALDHLNRAAMLAGLRPQTERTLEGGRRLIEKRAWLEAVNRVEKDVIAIEPGGQIKAWRESVRVYHPEELEAMMRQVGLEPLARHGDYGGAPWRPDSPRLILLARKP
jgi:ubiquinone/menaquinone biosynthesis C-methylase UbiE